MVDQVATAKEKSVENKDSQYGLRIRKFSYSEFNIRGLFLK